MSSRVWVFTIFVEDDEARVAWDEELMVHLVYQLEQCPETGRKHLQGCVRFARPCKLGQAKTWIKSDKAHMEKAIAWDKAVEYAKKDDTRVSGPWEHGHSPGQGKRSDLESISMRVRDGESLVSVARSAPHMYVKYWKGLERLGQLLNPAPAICRECIVLIGQTGVGKTRAVFDRYPDVFFVPDICHPWFDGYLGQDVIILDECGPGMVSINFVKRLLDRYPMQVPTKGGFAPLKASKVFLTSNRSMIEWWHGPTATDLDAILRRVKVMHLPGDQRALDAVLNAPGVPKAAAVPGAAVAREEAWSQASELPPFEVEDDPRLFGDEVFV